MEKYSSTHGCTYRLIEYFVDAINGTLFIHRVSLGSKCRTFNNGICCLENIVGLTGKLTTARNGILGGDA
jgi:hypothetical protein